MTTVAVAPAFGYGTPDAAGSARSAAQPANVPFGQDAATPAQSSPENQPEQATPAQAKSLQGVTVTGSLIRSANQQSGSPVATVNTQDLKRGEVSVSLTEQLNHLPQFSATSSRFYGTNPVQTIDLRGLGSNRNLVLLDGHRLPLATASGEVAINLIPEVAIGRLDVVTGGASAVYGSDAMSGVVNFHTIPYFDGIKGDVQYANSTRGDFPQQSASVAIGSGFADDKGHLMMAFGYTRNGELLGSKRKFFRDKVPSSYLGTGLYVPSATNLPDQAVLNQLFTGYGPYAPVNNTLALGYNNDGTLFTERGAKNYKGPVGTDGFAIIDGNVRMPVGQQDIIGHPVKRKQAFSKMEIDFAPHFTAYGQFLWVKSQSNESIGLSLTQFAIPTIPVTNPFIPADLKTILASRPDPTAPFILKTRYVGVPLRRFVNQYTTSRFLVGAKGKLFGDWTYDAHVSHSTTDHTEQILSAVVEPRVQMLLNAPDGGDSICSGGFNPFGLDNAKNISQACLDYMTITAHSQESLTQNIVQASMQGSLFQLPAGPVKMALLADTRRNSYSFTPDAELAAGNLEATAASAPASGATQVWETATQFQVPLLSDVPLAKKLVMDLAYRYSKYHLAGSVHTYEGDVKWRPVNSLLIRAGYQRAIRAPNIGELFAAAQGTQVGFGTPPASIGDPCDIRSPARTGANGAQVEQLCEAQGMPASVIANYTFPTTAVAGVQEGNRGLSPEHAKTWNVGLQWTSTSNSELLSTMSLSLDYWNINIENVISVVPGLTTLSKCYNLDGSNPNYSTSNTFCNLIHRDSNGLLVLVETPYENLGALKTDGIDAQFNWTPSLASLGISAGGYIFLNGQVGYTRSFKVQTLPGGPVQDFVNTISQGIPHPQWKAVATVGYSNDRYSVGFRWNYLGAMRARTSVTNPGSSAPGTPMYQTYDLFGSYFLNYDLELRMGVSDLTDKKSNPVANGTTGTAPSVYSPIGRSYYIGLHFSL